MPAIFIQKVFFVPQKLVFTILLAGLPLLQIADRPLCLVYLSMCYFATAPYCACAGGAG